MRSSSPAPGPAVVVVAGLLALTGTLSGQSSLSLDAAVDLARRTHPLLAASSGRVAAAESATVQASLRPNPRLFLQTENLRNWSSIHSDNSQQTDTFAYLSQPIEVAGKRGLRTATADAARRRTEVEREVLERQIVVQVKRAYWNAVAASRIHGAILENLELFRQIIDYHEKRVREGALPEADLLRVQLEGERLRLAANTASLDADRARIELQRSMGQTEFPALQLTATLDAAFPAPAVDVDKALRERPEMRLARQMREEATANLALQRALARPDVDVIAGYKRTMGLATVMGGVQWTLPMHNRNQGNIGVAEASIRVADSDQAATAAMIRAEIKSAETDLAIRRQQVSASLPKLLAQAEESARIALAAYREGGSDLLRLLDAQRVRLDLQALYVRTLADYHQSIVALEAAMGVN